MSYPRESLSFVRFGKLLIFITAAKVGVIMSDARDTLFRYLTMLQLIPRFPGRIATPVLKEKLAERGFKIDTRSLQRDLSQKLDLFVSVKICWFYLLEL